MQKFQFRPLVGLAITVLISACGGGGSGSNSLAPAAPSQVTTPAPTQTTFTPGQFSPASNFKGLCANPRPGDSRDAAGNTVDENNWLRSWSNETYLWYDEIADADPAQYDTPEYFDLMRTTATTPSGAPRDKFHFTIDTEEYVALSQSGITAGYGVEFALLSTAPPREIVVAYTEPNSPASAAGVNLQRGARILEVDGVDAVNGGTQADVDVLNAALFPSEPGESHEFLVLDADGVTQRVVVMVSEEVTTDPVQNERIEVTANGPVGYLTFNSHIRTAQDQLISAMQDFANAGVSELVLDMRYNGGGFLYLANELASMIAGPSVSGQVFEEIQFNDKHPTTNPVTGENLTPDLFRTNAVDPFDGSTGDTLPALNLSRVFVLSGPGTCSASESIINGLRGVNVEVVLIGDTTCGKPYGFYATDNCGTSYFTVQFRGVNALNFGDYGDGFSPANLPQTAGVALPGCAVADDFSNPLGDPAEARFAAALNYIANGSCPPPSTSFSPSSTTGPFNRTQQVEGAGTLSIRTAKPGMPGTIRFR